MNNTVANIHATAATLPKGPRREYHLNGNDTLVGQLKIYCPGSFVFPDS